MKKEKIAKIIFIILMIIVIIIAANYIYNLDKTSFENHSFYQYFGPIKAEYSGDIEISNKTNGITNLKMNDVNIEQDGTPIYYQDIENRALFTKNMAIVFPLNEGRMQKLNYFSEIQLIDDIPYLEYRNEKKSVKNAFLYNGGDMYVFLEPTTICVGKETYEISPLSYVIASYGMYVEIYDKSSDTYTSLELEESNNENIIAKTQNYEINLKKDSLKCGERSQLLLKKIDSLNNYFSE